ncbi:MAG: DUF177 domain-containing protein [Pelovirga sp.]
MYVELKHIKGGQLEQEHTCDPGDFPELAVLSKEHGAAYDGPVQIFLRFRQSARMVEVDGRLQATLVVTCGRCLGAFQYELAESFALTFVPDQGEEDSAAERELEYNELGMIPYRDDRLELLEPLQEQLIMAIPIRALCNDHCRGLCPECGADLNHSSCDCEKKLFNSKFGVLAQLKGQ